MKRFLVDKNAQIPTLPGVKLEDGFVCFPDTYSNKEISDIRERMQKGRGEIDIAPTRKAYTPTDEEKNAILEKVDSLEGFGFYEAVAAQTYVDRHRDILSMPFLQVMAKKYQEGRAIVHNHSHSYPVGYTFGATIESLQDGNSQLIVKFYISPSALLISGQNALDSVKDGLVRRVSVSFSSPSVSYTPSDESPDGESFWTYNIPEEGEDKVEVYELSLVTMGAQAGAVIKDAQNGPIDPQPTFEKTETKSKKKNMRNIEIAKGLTIEISDEQAEKALEIQNRFKELETAEAKLKVYQDKEVALIEEKAIQLVNLKKEVLGEEAVNAETEKALAAKLTIEQLDGQIKQFKTLKADKIKNITPTPEPKPETAKKTAGHNWIR